MARADHLYAPIGFHTPESDLTEVQKQALTILLIHTRYFKMTNVFLTKVAAGCQAAMDSNDGICQIWFYKESPMIYTGKATFVKTVF